MLELAHLLEANGITVWRDGDRVLGGQYYGEEIAHAITHSRVIMLMCSPHSFQSDNVRREVLLTWEYAHRRYVPVWLSPATEIPERFRYCLAGCQWIDAHSQHQDQWLPQLLKAFRALGVDINDEPERHPARTEPRTPEITKSQFVAPDLGVERRRPVRGPAIPGRVMAQGGGLPRPRWYWPGYSV